MSFEYYDLKRTLEELQIEESDLVNLISEGELRAYRENEEVRFLKADVDDPTVAHKIRTAKKVLGRKARADVSSANRRSRKKMAEKSTRLEIDEDDFFDPEELEVQDSDLFGQGETKVGAQKLNVRKRSPGPESPQSEPPIHRVRKKLKDRARKDLLSGGGKEKSQTARNRKAKTRAKRKVYVKPLEDHDPELTQDANPKVGGAAPTRAKREPDNRVVRRKKSNELPSHQKTSWEESDRTKVTSQSSTESESDTDGFQVRKGGLGKILQGVRESRPDSSPTDGLANPAVRKGAVVGVMLLLFGLIFMYNLKGGLQGGERVLVQKARFGEIRVEVKAPGRILAEVKKQVKSQVAGIVAEVLVRQGELVEVGQSLIRLISEDLDSEFRSAQTSLDRARERRKEVEVELGNARKNLEWEKRQLPIRKQEVETRIDQAKADVAKAKITVDLQRLAWEKARRDYEDYGAQDPIAKAPGKEAELRNLSSRAQLEYETARQEHSKVKLREHAAKLELLKVGNLGKLEGSIDVLVQSIATADQDIKKAQEDLDQIGRRQQKLVVSSPITGTVEDLQVIQRDRVDPSLVVATILDKTKLIVLAEVDETDALAVRPGQEVEIRVDALGEKIFQGRVLEIGTEGKRPDRSSEVSIFETRIQILGDPRSRHELRPGLSAQVRIQTKRDEGVLVVPQKAVVKRNGKQVLFVVERNGEQRIARRIAIETGVSDNLQVSVLSGLTEGESVILGPARVLEGLSDGHLILPELKD
ncbi:MAG: efflux RND transporter periplasmic adaptor subunit [Planctomycetota bacterium]|jgi:RND family efflux transporter MFP subunit|nr:efflux RND transporter periplasmic adaptor subunit [Planctomycetota bacterium]